MGVQYSESSDGPAQSVDWSHAVDSIGRWSCVIHRLDESAPAVEGLAVAVDDLPLH